MKSRHYKLNGKLFRYDFDCCVVEYIFEAGMEEITYEAEWKSKYGKGLYDIDDDGYIVLDTAGFQKDNWMNTESRNEYLAGWMVELDEESAALSANFVKHELPYLNGDVGK